MKKINIIFLMAFLTNRIYSVSLCHVMKYLPENPIILEAGSYDGHDTICLASTFPEGVIHAFEPIPQYHSILVDKMKEYKNIKLYKLALNTFSGRADFYYNSNNPGSSSLLPSSENFKNYYTDDIIQVQCITLEDWIKNNKIDHIDLMWLDMEGMEYQVLSSYEKVLDKCSCCIIEVNFLEFRQGMSMNFQIEKLLTDHGFSCIFIHGEEFQNDQVWIKKTIG